MDNIFTFKGRQQPPHRTARVRPLGSQMGMGGAFPLTILTGHKDELRPARDFAGDSVCPWAYIASRRWSVTYDRGCMQPYNSNAAND